MSRWSGGPFVERTVVVNIALLVMCMQVAVVDVAVAEAVAGRGEELADRVDHHHAGRRKLQSGADFSFSCS